MTGTCNYNSLLDQEAGMVLLGWNLDSMLRAEFSQSTRDVSLFEPAYPSEKNITHDSKQ